MPIYLPSNQSVAEGGGELRRKRFGKERGLEPRMEHTMRQVDSRSIDKLCASLRCHVINSLSVDGLIYFYSKSNTDTDDVFRKFCFVQLKIGYRETAWIHFIVKSMCL